MREHADRRETIDNTSLEQLTNSHWTPIVTVLLPRPPGNCNDAETVPAGVLAGSVATTWYSPTLPGLSPTKLGVVVV